MQGRKRKSPFIGTSESLGQSGSTILYDRYTDVSQLLLEPAGTIAAPVTDTDSIKGQKGNKIGAQLASLVQGAENGKAEGKKKKKKKLTSEDNGANHAANEAEGAATNGTATDVEAVPHASQANGTTQDDSGQENGPKKKGKKKRDKIDGETTEKKATSGPANTVEALRIRSIMGIAPAAGAVASQPQTFGFGFIQSNANGGAEQPEESAHPADSDAPSAGAEPDREADLELDGRLQRVMGEAGPSHVKRRVFVGGMPFSYEEADVRDYWSYCGEIEDLDLMVFPDTGRFKGIAFITFAEESGYREALKCNGMMLDDVRLKVEPCISIPAKNKRKKGQREPERKAHASPAPKTPGYHVAYVGNVAFEASPEQLKAVFEGCNVKVVRLHTDKHTGKSKGYAHVHFGDEESLDRAMEFDGIPLQGRSIKVGYAQPKKE